MESRKAKTDQEREPGVVDDRQTKRPRVEVEDALDNEEGDEIAPRLALQASDLYLDTVRLSRVAISMRVLMRVFADKSRQFGL